MTTCGLYYRACPHCSHLAYDEWGQLLEAAQYGRSDDVIESLNDGAEIEFKDRVRPYELNAVQISQQISWIAHNRRIHESAHCSIDFL